MIPIERSLSFIQSGINQRGSTLLMGDQTLIQYINIAALNIYTYEGRQWSWMRQVETVTIPAVTTNDTTYEATLSKVIIDIQNICSDGGGKCGGGEYIQKGSDCGLGSGDYYINGYDKKIVFARHSEERTIEITYFGYNLYTEEDIPVSGETIIVPEIFLPALYHFTLAVVYPHYTQYGEAREMSAYQMGINYLMNVAKGSTTVLNSIRTR